MAAPPDPDGLQRLVCEIGTVGGPVVEKVELMTGARFVHDAPEFLGWDVEIADVQRGTTSESTPRRRAISSSATLSEAPQQSRGREDLSMSENARADHLRQRRADVGRELRRSSGPDQQAASSVSEASSQTNSCRLLAPRRQGLARRRCVRCYL